jgi:hypothetical protein
MSKIPFVKVESSQNPESSFILSSAPKPSEKAPKPSKEKEKVETPKVVDEATAAKMKVVRYCEGQIWEDKSMADWPESLNFFKGIDLLFFFFYRLLSNLLWGFR